MKREIIEKLILKLLDEEEGSLTSSKNTEFPTFSKLIGEWVIVRTYSAGVFYGKLLESINTFVRLDEARCIWRWKGKGAFTLLEIAMGANVCDSKITCRMDDPLELTQAIEILPLKSEALTNLNAVKNYEY